MVEKDRLFYKEGSRGRLSTIDVRLVEKCQNGTIFHSCNHKNIKAISIYDESAEFLFKDGTIEVRNVIHRRSIPFESEIYIYGGMVCATKNEIHFLGAYNGESAIKGHKSSANIRINDAIVYGEGVSYDNEWKWEFLDKGSAEYIRKDQDLSDEIGVSSDIIVVGFDKEIETLELARPLI